MGGGGGVLTDSSPLTPSLTLPGAHVLRSVRCIFYLHRVTRLQRPTLQIHLAFCPQDYVI